MRFILGGGGRLTEELQKFPIYYRDAFLSSGILITCAVGGNYIVAACGILGLSNYMMYYVETGYRGRGLGTQMFEKAIGVARKRGLNFISSSVSLRNIPSLHLLRKFRFREIVLLKKFDYVIMMLPLTFKGELIYALLHITCSKSPKTFLAYLIESLMRIAAWIRQDYKSIRPNVGSF